MEVAERHVCTDGEMKMSGDDLLPRIMAKVEIVEGGCWLWHGLVASNGLTPRFRFSKDGKRLEFSVRRVLYEHYIGEPPKNIHVSCGNPRCVNPAHVEIVVAKTNAEVCREYQAKKAQKQLSSLDRVSSLGAPVRLPLRGDIEGNLRYMSELTYYTQVWYNNYDG